MVATGTKIAATDYNTIQTLVGQVLGVNTGGGAYGYGQNVDSSQVSVSSKISVTQWRNLRTDILRCRQHQTGTDLSGNLLNPTVSNKVQATDREAYLTLMQTAALDVNRLGVPPSATEATRSNLVTNQTKTPGWNTTVTQTITVTYPGYALTSTSVSAADHARCYFNTGSRFEFSSSLSGGQYLTPGTKDNSWYNLLAGMGTIYFNRSNTTSTGDGTPAAIGWANLTTTDQTIYTKSLSTGYAPNRFRILARAPTASTIVFTLYWEDLATYQPSPNDGWYVDETVGGTVTSVVQIYRATGSNVSMPAPTAVTTTIA